MVYKHKVLDKGYVSLRDKMGNDFTPADVARVSFDKRAEEFSGEKNESLINYLFRNKEYSCIRHNVMSFEIYMPLMVARQIYKYSIGSSFREDQYGWNESCLPADAPIWSYDDKQYTVQDLLDGEIFPMRSVNDKGKIVPNRINAIWPTGKHEVFEVTDELGNKTRTTKTHRFLTESGYVELSQLEVGDKIAHNGLPAYMDKEWLEERSHELTVKEIATICGVSDRTISKWKSEFGLIGVRPQPLYQNKEWLRENYLVKNRTLNDIKEELGCSIHVIRKWVRIHNLQKNHIEVLKTYVKDNGPFGKGLSAVDNPVLHERAQKSKEARLNNGGFAVPGGEGHHSWRGGKTENQSTMHKRARKIAIDNGWRYCFYCENKMEEVHHKDHNWKNNSEENLLPLCKKHHYLIHGKRPIVSGFAKIISIESLGEQEVYDIEMALEPNFISGGLVVHNSRRYITEEPEFYIPEHNQWRTAPDNKKQGSGAPLPDEKGKQFTELLMKHIDKSVEIYDAAIDNGVAVEEARLFLPAYGMYVRCYWTGSLNALFHFLDERLEHDAQFEIQQYARAIEAIIEDEFPIIYNAWRDNR